MGFRVDFGKYIGFYRHCTVRVHQHGQDSATRSLGVGYLGFGVDIVVTLNPKLSVI